MIRIFYFAAFMLFTAFCVIIAVSNRSIATFSLNPLPFTWDLPLYLLFFIGIFVGLGAGMMLLVAKSIKQAQYNRKKLRKIRDLDLKIQELENQLQGLTPQ